MSRMNYFLLKVFLVSVLPFFGFSAKFPSFLTQCKRDDPNLNQCLLRMFQMIVPRLNDGIPELFIPPTSTVPKVILNTHQGLQTICTNLKWIGHEKVEVKKFNMDLKNNYLELNFLFPKLDAETDYSLKGSLLGLQFDEQGFAIGNLTNVQEDFFINFERYTKNGKEYLKIKSNTVKLSFDKATIQLENLFGNDTEAGKQANKLINDNFESLFDTARPVVYEVVIEYFNGLTKRLFESFSFDELFL